MAASSKTPSENMFTRCIKAPFRALCKARDFYVKSMTDCAGSMSSGIYYPSSLPRSFSVGSSRADDEDLQEVMRMMSRRSQREQAAKSPQGPALATTGLPKSFSVGIGRIDEEKPCYFQEEFKANTDVMYPRSRSYAVTNRRTGRFIS